jgi:hypothetical protein
LRITDFWISRLKNGSRVQLWGFLIDLPQQLSVIRAKIEQKIRAG